MMEICSETEDCKLSGWESTPAEILLLILKHLSAEDLLACRSVSSTWRTVADYQGEKSGAWSHLLHNLRNKGYNACQRTKLYYLDLYLNYHMWYAVHKSQVTLKRVYDMKDINKIHIYKDTLIVVFGNIVKFFNLETGVMIKDIIGVCLDYLETDYWKAIVGLKEGKKNLLLFSKMHNKTFESLGFKILNIHHNKCHLASWKNMVEFYESTPEGVVTKLLGRYYSGSMRRFHMYGDEMFIYVMNGDVFHRRSGDLNIKKVCKLDVPPSPGLSYITMFHKQSVVYGVLNKENECIVRNYDINGEEHLVLLYHGATCGVSLDDILVLGFQDGKVGVVIINKLWTTNDLTPAFEFYVHEVAGRAEAEEIRLVEVYEGDSCHHVIAVTANNVFQVVISQPDYKKVMP